MASHSVYAYPVREGVPVTKTAIIRELRDTAAMFEQVADEFGGKRVARLTMDPTAWRDTAALLREAAKRL